MKNLPIDLYKKIQALSEEVKSDLKKKGIVAPVKNNDGSISIGRYKIIRNDTKYSIVDSSNDIVVDNLNLPQSAVLVANGLALGRHKDITVINFDRLYGYALFEEELHKKAVLNSKKKTLAHYDIMTAKATNDKSKKELYKRDLLNRYQKLIHLV